MTIDFLAPHQQKAVDELHNGAILYADPGSGKSRTALAYYFTKVCKGVIHDLGSMRDPVDLYIITTAKKRDTLDWQSDCVHLGLSSRPDLSIHGITYTVDSWNNIEKYKDVKNAFFIFDEQRLVGSGAWVKSFLKISKANQWIMLSGTPGDTWLDYIPVFVANGFYKNRTEFKLRHVVYNAYSKFPKVDHFVETGILNRNRNAVLVRMYHRRHTVRHSERCPVVYDEALFKEAVTRRWNVFENRPMKDVSELFIVMRKIVNSDSSRLMTVSELQLKHQNLIVFYNFDYELLLLRNHLESMQVTFAEWNGHKHEKIPTTDGWIYLVQYQAGAEGWNCTETDAMCFYSLPYSYKLWEQAHGRIDRMNTPYTDLFYYILISTSTIDKLIWRSLSGKQSFNESAGVREVGMKG